MSGSIITIVIALIGIAIAWKVLAGMVKLGVIAVLVVVAAYLLSQGTV